MFTIIDTMKRIPLSESAAIAVAERLGVGWVGSGHECGTRNDSGVGTKYGSGRADGSVYGWGNSLFIGCGSGSVEPGKGSWDEDIEVFQ